MSFISHSLILYIPSLIYSFSYIFILLYIHSLIYSFSSSLHLSDHLYISNTKLYPCIHSLFILLTYTKNKKIFSKFSSNLQNLLLYISSFLLKTQVNCKNTIITSNTTLFTSKIYIKNNSTFHVSIKYLPYPFLTHNSLTKIIQTIRSSEHQND